MEDKENMTCSCGRMLIPIYDKNGKRIGVTHETIEDEDYHLNFWTAESIAKRSKMN
ncbi:hypothetical protein [Sphingobacterium mizutaii]|uniref:hypothetical protein n=1 Tax=Sphingobacterium mizutaii TaxID=1010 RepID=UPI0028973466|nr:hypothetical protein [Sphingobacterium mizutaii]